MSMKISVFWIVALTRPDYTAQQPRRQKSSYSDDGGSMTYETLVNFYQTTRRDNPYDIHHLSPYTKQHSKMKVIFMYF
jgi:hypothetical protein